MFKKFGLLTVSTLACLMGLAGCNNNTDDVKKDDNDFNQNEDNWEKKDLTLALTGALDYIDGYNAWDPAFSQQTDALKFTKADDGVYTLDFDFVKGKDYKIVSGSSWNEPNYGISSVDTEKSVDTISGTDNITCTADTKVKITFYEYPFQHADKIDSTKKIIITARE